MKTLKRIVLTSVLIIYVLIGKAQQKMGHIDAQDVYTNMEEAKTVTITLQSLQKQKEVELEKMQIEFKTKYDAAVLKSKSISEINREVVNKELAVIETELDDMKKRIDLASQKAQEDLANKQKELLSPINTKFVNTVKGVAKEMGLAYVFDVSNRIEVGGVLVWDGGIDITNAVKTKLGIVAKPLKK
jgi:outer membrane protein